MTFEDRLKDLEAEKEQLIAQLNATIGKQVVLAELIEERDALPDMELVED